MEKVAISVKDVSKNFKLPHERVGSIKALVTQPFRKKSNGRYENQHALNNITFDIKQGEFFGIVGRNGSGKSTLLKIIAGIYQPTRGKVKVNGRLVPFIELGVGFNPELTGKENVYLNGALLGFSRSEIDAIYDEIVRFAELEKFMDQKLKNYSSGMQVRLAFSMAIRADADILLVDEVLAVGDADFQRKCLDYFRLLKKNKKTVVFVSHDMNSVKQFCDRVAFIEKSKLIMLDDASTVADAYTKMFLAESDEETTETSERAQNRWGDGAAYYPRISVTHDRKSNLTYIVAEVVARKAIEKPNYGFTVKDFSGNSLFGWNTNLAGVKVDDLNEGSVAKLRWTLPYIFNEGEYYIDVAIGYNQGLTADWWQEATSFRIVRDRNTPYLVNPEIITEVIQ